MKALSARLLFVLAIALAFAVLVLVPPAENVQAADGKPVARPVVLPDVPPLFRLLVEREASEVWGASAPIARVAGQLHQESLWDPDAQSAYAHGIAQFTPATAAWISQKFPRQLGDFDPWNPAHGIRALVIYDHWLLQRVQGASECDDWAFALSGYNGGPGWVDRDRKRAAAAGDDPSIWFGHVDQHSGRANWAIRENRGYVRNILLRWEPAYIAAGWPGTAACGTQP